MALRFTKDVFGNQAIELAGRVVHPNLQTRKIGSAMLRHFIDLEKPNILTTYTRNPAILNMICRVSDQVYPLNNTDLDLKAVAENMPYAESAQTGEVYHFNRYGEEGLFRGFDPADSPIIAKGRSLKEVFPELHNYRHALVVAARVSKKLDAVEEVEII